MNLNTNLSILKLKIFFFTKTSSQIFICFFDNARGSINSKVVGERPSDWSICSYILFSNRPPNTDCIFVIFCLLGGSAGVAGKAPIINVGNKNIGSAGWVSNIHWALGWTVTKNEFFSAYP